METGFRAHGDDGRNEHADPRVDLAASTSIRRCVFELVVSDGALSSAPSTVTVTVVPNYGTSTLRLNNPPFDPLGQPAAGFGGGNCTTGGSMTFGGVWDVLANWITVDSYGPSYTKYGIC